MGRRRTKFRARRKSGQVLNRTISRPQEWFRRFDRPLVRSADGTSDLFERRRLRL